MNLCSTAAARCLRSRRHRALGQQGVSLIEVLVGIAVMMPMTMAGVSGLLLAVETSAAAEQRQELEVALSATGEHLRSMPYLPCGTAEEYQKLLSVWSEPVSAELLESERPDPPKLTSVEHWNRNKQEYTADCSGDDGAQRIVMSLSEGDISTTGSVVKRDPNARVGNS